MTQAFCPRKGHISFKSAVSPPVHNVCYADFSLLFCAFSLSPAPSANPLKDPLGQDPLEICPRSYFETISDRLARPLAHFRLITPSLCDTNQLWMKKKKKNLCNDAQKPLMCRTPQAARGTQRRGEEGDEEEEETSPRLSLISRSFL